MYRVQQNNEKTASPFQYILQAAMGQCSNLPAGANKDNGSDEGPMSPASNSKSQRASSVRSVSSSARKVYREQRDSNVYRSGRQSDDERYGDGDGDVDMEDNFASDRIARGSSRDVNRMVNIAKQGNSKFDEFMNEDYEYEESPQHTQSSYHSRFARNSRSKIAPSPEEIFPPPPLGAVRTRCYRLNLDAPVILSPTHDHLGPMPYETPSHLLPQRSARQIMSTFSEESTERDPVKAAIDTARIFRGITVDTNGTILNQNARATRSNRASKDKNKQQAASSRQQDKINKAKDLVDEANGLGTGKVCCTDFSQYC